MADARGGGEGGAVHCGVRAAEREIGTEHIRGGSEARGRGQN